MNKQLLTRSLVSAGLFALVGAVGAQTYYTHELVKKVAAQEGAQPPAEQVETTPADPPPAMAQTNPPDADVWDIWNHSGDPWAAMHADIRRMQAEMDRMFNTGFPSLHHSGWPAISGSEAKVSMEEQGEDYVVKAQIPGAKESDINVNLDGRLLSISSSTQGTEKQTADKNQQTAEEFYSSSFQQAFTLPGPVSANGMHSEFKDGVLTVTIPKAG